VPFLSHHGKSLVHPSRTLRRGSGGVDLAIHVSAPRALRPPLRTVIEETWWTFFTHARDVRSNAVNSRRPVLSMSGYPCRGWRDSSKEPSVFTDIISCEAISFRPKGEARFWVLMFLRYVLLKSTLLWCWVSHEVFRLLYAIRMQVSPFERSCLLLKILI
jgi:hypothetical protein